MGSMMLGKGQSYEPRDPASNVKFTVYPHMGKAATARVEVSKLDGSTSSVKLEARPEEPAARSIRDVTKAVNIGPAEVELDFGRPE